MAAEISIITPWLDRPELIEDYERTVGADGAEVIIVDNGSARGNSAALKAMVQRLGGKYIRNEENRWFSAANNQGLALATAPIILFLNNDIAGDPAWIANVRRDVQPNALYGRSADQTVIEGRTLPYLEGWCLTAQRPVFDRLGGWDAKTYAMPYFEDIDLCLQAVAYGFKLVQVDWPVTHKKNSTSGFVPGVRYAIDRNRQAFIARLRGAGALPKMELRQPCDFLVAGRLPEGEAHFRQAVQQQPHRADLWLAYGQVLDLSGRFEASKDALSRAIELNPRLADAYHALGTLYMQTLCYREAAEQYRKVAQLLPYSADALANLASAHRLNGDYAAAIDAAHRALSINSILLLAHVEASQALREQGRATEALSAAQAACHHHPQSAEAHYVLGLALQSSGRLQGARAALERTRTLDPRHGMAIYALRMADAQLAAVRQASSAV